jgi:hypothetical protein
LVAAPQAAATSPADHPLEIVHNTDPSWFVTRQWRGQIVSATPAAITTATAASVRPIRFEGILNCLGFRSSPARVTEFSPLRHPLRPGDESNDKDKDPNEQAAHQRLVPWHTQPMVNPHRGGRGGRDEHEQIVQACHPVAPSEIGT